MGGVGMIHNRRLQPVSTETAIMRLIRSTAIMRQLQHAPSTTLSRFTGTSLVSGSRATYMSCPSYQVNLTFVRDRVEMTGAVIGGATQHDDVNLFFHPLRFHQPKIC